MNISFNLFSPKAEKSPIRMVVTHKGQVLRKAVGITIPTARWSADKKKAKDREVDIRLRELRSRVETLAGIDPSPDKLSWAVNTALEGKGGEGVSFAPNGTIRPSFWDFFKEWASEERPSKKDRQVAYNRLSALMGTEEDWEQIDEGYITRLKGRLNSAKYSANYQATLLGKLRSVLLQGKRLGYHSSNGLESIHYKWETADTVYVTKEELQRLWKCKSLNPSEQRAVDLFTVGVFTASRFKEYSQLSEKNIIDGKLRFVQSKTGGAVVIPLSPKVKAVFDKYGGGVPKMTCQELGRWMKSAARKAGGSFLDIIESRKTRGGVVEVERKPKWQMISAHTARRSGATLLYLQGVPIRICRFLTGHKSDSQFLNYVKVKMDEGAEILAKSQFFK